MPGKAGHKRSDLGGIEPLHVIGLVRGKSAWIRCQTDPVELYQPEASGSDLIKVSPAFQAGSLHIDEGLRVAPLMRLRDQQPGRAAGRAGPEPAGLDQLYRSHPS